MKTTTTMIQMLGALGLLAGGCTASEPGSHGSAGSLEACADTVREGAVCDFDREIACADRGTDLICRCARSTDGGGRVVCERRSPPDPGGGTGTDFCTDHVRSGEACDAAPDVECRHACDPSILCRCVPASDATDPAGSTDPTVARRVWVCGAPVPPPVGTADTCTDWHVAACRDPMRDPAVSCVRGGAVCRCGVSADGTVGLVCEVPPPPPPGGRECTDAIIASCIDATIARDPSSTVDAVLCYRDGRACRCAPTADGRAEVVCEDPRVPPVPGTDTCTDELLRICAAGMPAECTSADGRHCWCDPRSAGPMGFICVDVPPPTPTTGACDDAALRRCLAGEPVECAAADGSHCRCDPSSTSATPFVCDGAPPPPTPGATYCTDADAARCAAGERVECTARDGTVCRCTSTSADMRLSLVCG